MKFKWRTWATAAIFLASQALLSACGNDVVSDYGSVNVSLTGGTASYSAGTAVSITGTAVTGSTILSTIAWNVAVPAGATSPTIGNQDCSTATKTTTTNTDTSSPATGSSNWVCTLSLEAPSTITATTAYTVSFTATDASGTVKTGTQTVTFVPLVGASKSLTANLGGAFSITPGSTAPLHCGASGGTSPYTYAWTITDNGGTAVSLTGYTGADTTFDSTSTSADVAVQCVVTDSAGATATALVNIAISNSTVSSLTASAGPSFSVTSGATVPLQCSSAGANGTVSYAWSITANGGLAVQLSSLDTQTSSFTAPTVTTATTITAKCTATDSASDTASSSVDVTVNPSGANTALTANAGTAFSVSAGETAPFHCDATGGTGPYSYQWVITSNGGLPISLSTYTASDTQFTAPSVSADTAVTLTCRATDNDGAVATSSVTATIDTSSTNTLVAKIVNLSSIVSPGQQVSLSSTGSGWYDSSGSSTTGSVVTYAWTTTASGVTFSDTTSASPVMVVPSSITTVTTIPVTLTVTSGSQTSTATSNYIVNPYGVLTLSVSPSSAAGSVSNVQSYTFAASTTYSGNATLYYQWTQVSGPSVDLGGDSTSSLGVSPTSTGSYVFRLAVGFQTIDSTNPGLYFTDVTLTITQ
jgi:hypothetical protein